MCSVFRESTSCGTLSASDLEGVNAKCGEDACDSYSILAHGRQGWAIIIHLQMNLSILHQILSQHVFDDSCAPACGLQCMVLIVIFASFLSDHFC